MRHRPTEFYCGVCDQVSPNPCVDIRPGKRRGRPIKGFHEPRRAKVRKSEVEAFNESEMPGFWEWVDRVLDIGNGYFGEF